MLRRTVCDNNIMLTVLLILVITIVFFGGMHIVKADEAVEYEKSFVSIEIKHGDTLTSIAQEYAKSAADYNDYIDEVKNINSLKDDTIHSGCYLLIPVYTLVE